MYSGLVLMLVFAVGYSSSLYGWQVRTVFDAVSAVVNKIFDKLIQIPFPEKIATGTTPPEAHPQAGGSQVEYA